MMRSNLVQKGFQKVSEKTVARSSFLLKNISVIRFVSLIFVACYAVVFINTNSAHAFGPATRIKITHTHEHAHVHHHSHEAAPAESKDKKEGPHPHHGGTQHSHEVSVGGQLVSAPSELRIPIAPADAQTLRFFPDEQRLPSSPSLLGIFRPPIA